ncbi:SDR family oxidoreductase [Kitasatospora sp. RB6PN24]|uniref:NAD(P)-dependent oxidoreductase n=1 Tax=Kitasatospora humi TaxID=2893891 RepID=UPI001E2D6B0C|nr:NAD(P)-binding oxidoreductase [Kitasatospora humi]MCC9305621.1 SDR family oxidoreductase [Kitasatospora humi]
MKLTILAASGGIGRQLLDQAVAADHDVTAVVRTPAKLAGTTGVRIVQADLATADGAALRPAVLGVDAVLSALGAVGKSGVGVAEHGTKAVLDAMRATGVERLVVVSAAPIGTVPSPGRPHPPRHDPGDGFLIRHLLGPAVKAVLRAHYADLARMEDALRASGLAWTAVRPPRLTDGPLTTTYRTALDRNLRGGTAISRASVAHFMLRTVGEPDTIGHTVGIAR